jgi:hypothetical protein
VIPKGTRFRGGYDLLPGAKHAEQESLRQVFNTNVSILFYSAIESRMGSRLADWGAELRASQSNDGASESRLVLVHVTNLMTNLNVQSPEPRRETRANLHLLVLDGVDDHVLSDGKAA